jgi:hypothetical protein
MRRCRILALATQEERSGWRSAAAVTVFLVAAAAPQRAFAQR